VVAEARLAWTDERGFSSDRVPGFGLDEVFGAREKLIRPVEHGKMFIAPNASLPGLKPGDTVRAEAFEEDLDPESGARVLAKFANGEPAIVEKRYGKGKAILIGSFPALSYQRQHEAPTARLLLALARAAGVTAEVEVSGPGTNEIEVRRLTSNRVQILFAFNHAKTPAQAAIRMKSPWASLTGRDLGRDEEVPVQVSGGKVLLEKNLAPGEIWVVELSPR
jgi:beta-galactosidase